MNPNRANDSDIANQSEVLVSYKQQLSQYYETMLQTFQQIDKNKDSLIDQQELLEFLDEKMPRGKVFDRTLFKKIFESMDTDHNGKVTM
jgi:Ca2+-binding EF-hand superfamily protein